MTISIIIAIVILLIIFIIWLLWKIESTIPNLEQSPSKTNNQDKYESIKNWFLILEQQKKFNGIVAFKKSGDVLINLKVGYKNHYKNQSIDDFTSFRLASVSKQFTAFAVMVLKKEQKLDYETKVNSIITDFKNPQITVRHLLNQTSGITVDYIKLANLNKKEKNHTLSIGKASKLISQYTSEEVIPLTSYLYNNSNYILLARIIEIVSKLSFEDFMRHNIFEKLELRNTFVWNLFSKKELTKMPNVAIGYEAYLKSNPSHVKATWIDGVAGDGGVFSSLSDLKKWISLWDGNTLLNKNDLNEAFKKPLLNNNTHSNYGFGWVIDDGISWHNGKWLGTNALIIKSMSNSSSLLIIDNSTNIRFDKITKILTQALFKKMINKKN
jgi:CubicO group peptidase (beta-lactamase class C family)